MGEAVKIYWNYRILKRVEEEGTENEEISLNIVEFYYQDNGSIVGWTKDEYVSAENLAGLRYTLECMLESLDKPIYVEEDLLAEAAISRENGDENIFPTQGISINEVIDSLGLEPEDVDMTSELNAVVSYLEPHQIEEEGEGFVPLVLVDSEIEEGKLGRYPAKINRPAKRPAVSGPTYPLTLSEDTSSNQQVNPVPDPRRSVPEEIARWEDNGGGIQ